MDLDALKKKVEQEEAALKSMVQDANRQIAYQNGKVDALKQLLAEMDPAIVQKQAVEAG